MLTFLRWWAVLQGSGLIIGESIRSWGQGRHPLFVLDDFFIGVPLLLTAWLVGSPTPMRKAAFSAAFAASAGMLYGSFFGKLLEPAADHSSSFDVGFLTFLVGLAFVSALVSLALSLKLWQSDS